MKLNEKLKELKARMDEIKKAETGEITANKVTGITWYMAEGKDIESVLAEMSADLRRETRFIEDRIALG